MTTNLIDCIYVFPLPDLFNNLVAYFYLLHWVTLNNAESIDGWFFFLICCFTLDWLIASLALFMFLRLLPWYLSTWSRSHFEFKLFSFHLTVEFEEMDVNSLDVCEWYLLHMSFIIRSTANATIVYFFYLIHFAFFRPSIRWPFCWPTSFSPKQSTDGRNLVLKVLFCSISHIWTFLSFVNPKLIKTINRRM